MTNKPSLKQKFIGKPIGKYLLMTGAVLLLIAQFCVQIHLAKVDSETSDEGSHLNAAFTYVTNGVFYFNPEHPALTKDLAGLSMELIHPKTTPEMKTLLKDSSNFFYDSWGNNLTSASLFLYKAGNDPNQLLFMGRLPYVLLTSILGVVIFLIAFFEWGEIAAFAATAIYTLDPTIAGHGHLMTTDIPIALGYLLVVYTTWKFLQKTTWPWAVALGGSVGFAFLTKFSAIIVIPAFFVLFCLAWFISKDKGYWKKVIPKLLLSIVVVVAVIWAGYGFHDRVAPAAFSFSSEMNYTSTHNGTLNGYIPPKVPTTGDKIYTDTRPALDLLPGDFVKGLYMVLGHSSNGQNEFFLGHYSTRGWWYYFPAILLLKLPIPTLILAAIAIYFVIRKRPTEWFPVATLIAAGVFLGVAMTSKADLGIRYIMPLFPLIALLVGYCVAKLTKLKYLFTFLFVWLAIIYLISYPFYISYFNSFVGGSYNGYKYRSDSDVDWGQDLKRIDSYIKTNNIHKVYLSYYWVGSDAVDYYLGTKNIYYLSNWKPGDGGNAIIGASFYELNNADSSVIKNNCIKLEHITPSVLTCKLK
jgi:hypothetical protein